MRDVEAAALNERASRAWSLAMAASTANARDSFTYQVTMSSRRNVFRISGSPSQAERSSAIGRSGAFATSARHVLSARSSSAGVNGACA